MDLVPFIEKPLLALKNTYSEHEKGFYSEHLVTEFLKTQDFKILFKRLKTKFGEVDLVVAKDAVTYLIEIKTVSNLDFISFRIGSKQKRRLFRNYEHLLSKFGDSVLLAAYVIKTGGNVEVLFQEISRF